MSTEATSVVAFAVERKFRSSVEGRMALFNEFAAENIEKALLLAIVHTLGLTVEGTVAIPDTVAWLSRRAIKALRRSRLGKPLSALLGRVFSVSNFLVLFTISLRLVRTLNQSNRLASA